jgi:hypothetical protein
MDSSEDSKGFFKHVFNFDDDSKSEILNIIQYAIIALIPVIIISKTISKYDPEADDNKSSLEISAEIIIKIIIMFIGLLLVHRMIIFIPTYSGVKYPDFNIIFIILAVLMIILGLQTNLGEKVNILVDRLMELWNGKEDKKKNGKGGKSGNVKVSQPISGQSGSITGQMMPQTQSTYTDGTSINSLPTSDVALSAGTTQQLPNYDNMYRQDTTPLVNANSPGQMEGFSSEPMAANSVLGGGAFGSW